MGRSVAKIAEDGVDGLEMSHLRSLHKSCNLVDRMCYIWSSICEEDKFVDKAPVWSRNCKGRLHIGEELDVLWQGSVRGVGMRHLRLEEEVMSIGSLMEI